MLSRADRGTGRPTASRHAAGADRSAHRPPRSCREDPPAARSGQRVFWRGARASRADVEDTRRSSTTCSSASSSCANPARRSRVRSRIASSTRSFARWPTPGWPSSPGRSTTHGLPSGSRRRPGRSSWKSAHTTSIRRSSFSRSSRVPPGGARPGDRGCARSRPSGRSSRLFSNARKLGLRAPELQPTLGARQRRGTRRVETSGLGCRSGRDGQGSGSGWRGGRSRLRSAGPHRPRRGVDQARWRCGSRADARRQGPRDPAPRLRRGRALRRSDHSRHGRGVARLRRRLRAVHGAHT